MNAKVQQAIGYKFKDEALLSEALTHTSMLQQNKSLKNYERFEFLGDAVLSLIITEMLMDEFPKEHEGDLAKRRASLISGPILHKIAQKIDISNFIVMSDVERNLGGHENPQILEDVVESLIGAMYIDGGLGPCAKFIHRFWEDTLKGMEKPPVDPKTFLQEWAQERRLGIPKYRVINRRGPDHSPEFEVEVEVRSLPKFTASHFSKKNAEKKAAKIMIEYIQVNHAKN